MQHDRTHIALNLYYDGMQDIIVITPAGYGLLWDVLNSRAENRKDLYTTTGHTNTYDDFVYVISSFAEI